jgi:hypothetical protein
MAPTYTYRLANPQLAEHRSFGTRMKQFWQRTTDGMELNQLWNQFRIDTRTSYRLYSRGIDYTCQKGVNEGRHWHAVSMQLFWAILEKLSPARRVLLLFAFLLLLFTPELSWTTKEGTPPHRRRSPVLGRPADVLVADAGSRRSRCHEARARDRA